VSGKIKVGKVEGPQGLLDRRERRLREKIIWWASAIADRWVGAEKNCQRNKDEVYATRGC